MTNKYSAKFNKEGIDIEWEFSNAMGSGTRVVCHIPYSQVLEELNIDLEHSPKQILFEGKRYVPMFFLKKTYERIVNLTDMFTANTDAHKKEIEQQKQTIRMMKLSLDRHYGMTFDPSHRRKLATMYCGLMGVGLTSFSVEGIYVNKGEGVGGDTSEWHGAFASFIEWSKVEEVLNENGLSLDG